MCGFFKRNCLGLKQFLLPSVLTGVCSQKWWGLIFLALEPWAGGPAVCLGLLAPEISLPNFYPLHMYVGLARSMSLPLLPVWMDVVNSIVVRLPFNLISDSPEGWLFYILVVILMWLCEEMIFTYVAFLTLTLYLI